MQNHSDAYSYYKNRVDGILASTINKKEPRTLYDPLKYILEGGGKRIRPMMVIFSCEATGGNPEDALNASVALELLHNFTLVHDDIMDNADTRRGRKTIHKKWNDNVAILSGDHLIGLAYTFLIKTNTKRLNEIIDAFTEGIIEVCEGQSYDKEFEVRKDVTLEEYLMMISKKTSKMLQTSAVVGALIGDASSEQIVNIREYAANIGLAFQILDDLLDIMAIESQLGKKIGGDLVEGKKTYLLLKAREVINDKKDKEKIENIIINNGLEKATEDKIIEIKNIYEKYDVIKSANEEIEKYTMLADRHLNTLPDGEAKERLKWFSNMLMSRSF